MKKVLQLIAIFLSAFFLENSFIPALNIPVPHLSLIFAFLSGIYFGAVKGSLLGLLLGLISDILFSYALGIKTLLLFIAGAFGASVKDFVHKKRFIFILLMFAVSAGYILARFLIDAFFLSNVKFAYYLQWRYLIVIIADVLLSVPCDLLFNKLFGEKELSFDS